MNECDGLADRRVSPVAPCVPRDARAVRTRAGSGGASELADEVRSDVAPPRAPRLGRGDGGAVAARAARRLLRRPLRRIRHGSSGGARTSDSRSGHREGPASARGAPARTFAEGFGGGRAALAARTRRRIRRPDSSAAPSPRARARGALDVHPLGWPTRPRRGRAESERRRREPGSSPPTPRASAVRSSSAASANASAATENTLTRECLTGPSAVARRRCSLPQHLHDREVAPRSTP